MTYKVSSGTLKICSLTHCFVDIRQHLTLSILAHFQNGDQQQTSNTDDERVSKFQLQRHSQKKFHYAFL